MFLTNERVGSSRGGEAESGQEEGGLHFGRGWCVFDWGKLCDLCDSGDSNSRKRAVSASICTRTRPSPRCQKRIIASPEQHFISTIPHELQTSQGYLVSLNPVVELASLALEPRPLPRNARTVLGLRTCTSAPLAEVIASLRSDTVTLRILDTRAEQNPAPSKQGRDFPRCRVAVHLAWNGNGGRHVSVKSHPENAKNVKQSL